MELINTLIEIPAHWLRDHLSLIAFAFIATLLMVFGDDINCLFKKQIGGLQFLLKVTLFIVFCTFGITLMTELLAPLAIQFLAQLDNLWLLIILILAFYGLGFIAQKKRLI